MKTQTYSPSSVAELPKTDEGIKNKSSFTEETVISVESGKHQQIESKDLEQGTNTNRESLGAFPKLNDQRPAGKSVAETVVKMLEVLGVKYAFGMVGGGILPMVAAIERSSIKVMHFRHEVGAAFAAVEAYFASGIPVVVFTTYGPGITNALTGLFAARWEGAKVIFISPSTSTSQQGRWAFQETSAYTMPVEGIFTSGKLFHYAVTLESDTLLQEIADRLTKGISQPGGFVAHINISPAVQTSESKVSLSVTEKNFSQHSVSVSKKTIKKCAKLLSEKPFAVWVGFGAGGAAKEIRKLAKRTGASVMCSPGGKGIFPEDHPQFIGVTGFGGHESVLNYMQDSCPEHLLVLGTRLSEFTSFWSPAMVPPGGFIHVDIDSQMPGSAYPDAKTIAVQSDAKVFVKQLLKYLKKRFPKRSKESIEVTLPRSQHQVLEMAQGFPVRPEVLMAAVQQVIVAGSDAVVITEAGNSFAWTTNTLRFAEPGRYRISAGFGSMGHAVTGVLGAALARSGKAVAIAGDGAMLMNSEVSTAVKYQIPAVWIVLNDSSYNMCAQGKILLGFKDIDTEFPQADFVQIARGMGADGIRVERECELKEALEKAMASKVPFVVDVIIDPTQPAPIGSRVESLIAQGSKE